MLCRFILRMANPTVRVAKKLFAVDWNSKIPARRWMFGFIIIRLPRVPILTLFFFFFLALRYIFPSVKNGWIGFLCFFCFFNNLSLRHKVKCLLILASMSSQSIHLSHRHALRTIVWKSAVRGGCIRQKGVPPGQAGPTGSLAQILGEARRGRPRPLPGGLRDSWKP